MNGIKRIFVWLCRLPYSYGFGIQSPTDYAFVREVVNEHGVYYAYQEFNKTGKDSLQSKLGKLYFRLANWRQPVMMLRDEYEKYWKAGCRNIQWTASLTCLELGRMVLEGNYRETFNLFCGMTDNDSILVIEGIFRDWDFWYEVERDSRTGVTFNLYYCGIVFFNKTRYKKNYKVNF